MQPGKTPFLRLLLPLCAGIIVSEYYDGSWLPGVVIMALAALSLLLLLLRKNAGNDIAAGAMIIVFVFAAGFLLHHAGETRYTLLDDERQTFLVRIDNFPEKKNKSYSFTVTIKEARDSEKCYYPAGKMLIYYVADSIPGRWQPGDYLRVQTRPLRIKNSGNPCEFNYSRYMEGNGVLHCCFVKAEDVCQYIPASRRSLRDYSAILASKMVLSFQKAGIEGDNLGLVTALTIGEKDLLDREQLASFSRAGVMHVMAVSGMHVGMISMFASSLLFFLKRRWQPLKIVIILIILWSFAFITGLSPSVMRATITFSFLQAGTMMKRQSNSMNTLLASAFILLAARPAVLFEAGFQLSYLAVAFIILFYEPLCALLRFRPGIKDWLWKMTAVSVVAQAGTFPLTVRLFNTFPVMFLAANIVIIPLSFVITILALILFPLADAWPVATVLGWILSRLAEITFSFTSFISSLPGSVITGIGMSAAETIILTITVALLLSLLERQLHLRLKAALLMLALYFAAGSFIIVREDNSEGIIVYNIHGTPLPALKSGHSLILLSPDGVIPDEVSRHAGTRRLRPVIIPAEADERIVTGSYAVDFVTGDKRIYSLMKGQSLLTVHLRPPGKEASRGSQTIISISPVMELTRTSGEIISHSTGDNGALIQLTGKRRTIRPLSVYPGL